MASTPVVDKETHLTNLVRRHTGFISFADMLNAFPTYRPSLNTKTNHYHGAQKELIELADAYDEAMEALGDPRRAYRY